jgi:phospholipase C
MTYLASNPQVLLLLFMHLESTKIEEVRVWNYAVSPGDRLNDRWLLEDFDQNQYHLRVYGPNGFLREYMGNAADPQIKVSCEYQIGKNGKPTGNIELKIDNLNQQTKYTVTVRDNAYKAKTVTKKVDMSGTKGSKSATIIDLQKSHQWYDFSVTVEGAAGFTKRFAGHVETGMESQSDPYMGGTIS